MEIGTPVLLNEDKRTYYFPNGTVEVVKPRELVVRPSGNHRIISEDGLLHIIPAGWLKITIADSSSTWTV